MSAPDKEELKNALSTAQEMRNTNQDPHHVARSLLTLDQRFRAAEHVVEAAKIYLHSGEGGTEHARLVKAIEDFDKTESKVSDGTLGLS